MNTDLNILSLGAGVQSSTLALMMIKGEVAPIPEYAIFADTQGEPKKVYEWLDWLQQKISFPVIRVSAGNLMEESLKVKKSKLGNYYTQHSIPAWIIDSEMKSGIMMRQCTTDFKIRIIQRKVKELLKKHSLKTCNMFIGISLEEMRRMKDSRVSFIKNVYPLVEKRKTRNDCLIWLEKNGFPIPPRSACVFCPFRNDREWSILKKESPDDFQLAANYEKRLQETMKKISGFRGTPYLHKSHLQISEVIFEDKNQLNLFENECEGMCGV